MLKRNKLSRVISFVVALVLLVGVLPNSTFALANNDFTPFDEIPQATNEYSAKGFVIRLLDSDGVQKTKKDYTIDELETMSETTTQYYTTGCMGSGIAGTKAQGVFLEKILADAGIEFKEGMQLKLRVGDSKTEDGYYRAGTFTYDYLMGQDRYYLPEFFNIIRENERLPKEERLGQKELNQKPEAWINKLPVKPFLAVTAYEHKIGETGSEDDLKTLEQLKNAEMTRDDSIRFTFGQSAVEDGSVSTDSTRMKAAKWVYGIDIIEAEKEPENTTVNALDYSVKTYNQDNTEKGQTLEVAVDFDDSIVVNENSSDDFDLTISGGNVLLPSVDKDGNNVPAARVLSLETNKTNDKQLIMTIKVNEAYKGMIAQFNGSLKISAKDGQLKDVRGKDGKQVAWEDIDTIIPTGITMNSKEYIKGTDMNVASVTKTVGSKSNVRGMVHIKALSNGEPILPNGGRFTTHAHNFISLKEEDYAKSIVASFNGALEKANLQDKYVGVWEEGSKDFTIKSLIPTLDEVIDVQMEEWTETTNRNKLNKLITDGKAYKSQEYTYASFEILRNAIGEAEAIVNNPLAKAKQIKSVELKIENAIKGLVIDKYEFDDNGIRIGVNLEDNFKGDWESKGQMTDVALDKFWTVTFSSEVKDEKIDGIVIEKDGKLIPVKIETVGKEKMKVSPVGGYEKDSTYKLKVYLYNGLGYSKEFTTIK